MVRRIILFAILLLARSAMAENVLFINIDDLNDFPAEYFVDLSTPNIDRLTAMGASFTNAHSPVPACNPSRTALLMGMHPETTGITYNSQFDFRAESAVLATKDSLPQHFKSEGFRIVGAGKLFHAPNDDAPSTVWDTYELELGAATFGDFNVPGDRPVNGISGLMLTDPDGIMSAIGVNVDWGYWEYNDAPTYADATDTTPDYERAAWAVTQIEDAPNQAQDMLVSVGLYRPHFPLYCPKRFFDLIPEPMTPVPYLSTDLDDIPNDPMGGPSYDADLKFASTRDGVDYMNQNGRAYAACVAFVDELLGTMLDAVDASAEDWSIVFWGDHGWHVGEKDRWSKFTLWDRGSHTSLIIAGTGITPGVEVAAPVSLLDVFPTMTDYAGISTPSHLEGESLRRFLDTPETEGSIRLILDQGNTPERFMAFRSERWSYILNIVTRGEELYDLDADPNEWTNVADNPAYDDIKRELCMTGGGPCYNSPEPASVTSTNSGGGGSGGGGSW